MSQIETEIKKYISSIKRWQLNHDKVLILAFRLSFIPAPPVSIISLSVGAFSLWLISKGSLDKSERTLAVITIMIAIISMVVFVVATFLIINNIEELKNIISNILEYYINFFEWFGFPKNTYLAGI